MYVVERIPAVLHERFLLTCYAVQDTKLEQIASDMNELAPLVHLLQRECESSRSKFRIGCRIEQAVAQRPKRDLRVGALQHGAHQAQQGVVAPRESNSSAGPISEIRRKLV